MNTKIFYYNEWDRMGCFSPEFSVSTYSDNGRELTESMEADNLMGVFLIMYTSGIGMVPLPELL